MLSSYSKIYMSCSQLHLLPVWQGGPTRGNICSILYLSDSELHLLPVWQGWPPGGAAGALHPGAKHRHRQGQAEDLSLRICRVNLSVSYTKIQRRRLHPNAEHLREMFSTS